MNANDVQVGVRYSYYPPQAADDNLHFPAVVEAKTKSRVKVRIFMEGSRDGLIRYIKASRLVDQADLLSHNID